MEENRSKPDQYQLRFPPGLRERLKEEAAKNERSMNAEIIARLEASLQEQLSIPPSLLERVTRLASRNNRTLQEQIIETLDSHVPRAMSLGAFIETWAVKAAKAKDQYQRASIISKAVNLPEVRSAGLSIRLHGRDDGSQEMLIIHTALDGDETVIGNFQIPKERV